MTSRTPRFAIFGNTFQAKKSASIQKLLSALREMRARVCIDHDYHVFLTETLQMHIPDIEVFEGRDFDADFAVSMGGDGTFLRTASRIGDKRIPILGINMGRLGFLAEVNPRELESCLHALSQGTYTIEERDLIQVKTDGEPFKDCDCALNDIAILKRDDASMIGVRTSINGNYLTTFQADGLVISTPTGSTAYSLSNGGPIIVPETKVFVVTAVAPHSLNVRPIVIPDTAELQLTVECRSQHFLVAIDGRSEICPQNTRLTVRKAPYPVRLVRICNRNYFQTLRNKMMWGAELI